MALSMNLFLKNEYNSINYRLLGYHSKSLRLIAKYQFLCIKISISIPTKNIIYIIH